MKGRTICMKNLTNMAQGEIRNNVTFEEFVKVFKVYEDYPFYESWSQEELRDEYNSYFKNNGWIFGYYINEKCVAILTLYPMIKGEHPVFYSSDEKVMYLSDIATLDEYRGKGIATQLFHFALRHTMVLRYDCIYLRTNFDEKESMSASIARKCGFKRILNVSQMVERKRIDGSIGSDLRMFMEKRLS